MRFTHFDEDGFAPEPMKHKGKWFEFDPWLAVVLAISSLVGSVIGTIAWLYLATLI